MPNLGDDVGLPELPAFVAIASAWRLSGTVSIMSTPRPSPIRYPSSTRSSPERIPFDRGCRGTCSRPLSLESLEPSESAAFRVRVSETEKSTSTSF